MHYAGKPSNGLFIRFVSIESILIGDKRNLSLLLGTKLPDKGRKTILTRKRQASPIAMAKPSIGGQ